MAVGVDDYNYAGSGAAMQPGQDGGSPLRKVA